MDITNIPIDAIKISRDVLYNTVQEKLYMKNLNLTGLGCIKHGKKLTNSLKELDKFILFLETEQL